jgi:uncharacterized protein YdhG (YjbR/CyaY superfamily)
MTTDLVAHYIATIPSDHQLRFVRIYTLLKKAFPKAQEVMSYQMPTLKQQRNLAHIACYPKHIGIYPGPTVIQSLQSLYPEETMSKGTWLIHHNQPLKTNVMKTLVQLIKDQSR